MHCLRFVGISTLGWYQKGTGSYYENEAALSVLNSGHDEGSEAEASVMHHALARL
jgi:hypothetical protein